MGTRYSTQSTSNYNQSPPADDGSQTAANQITWAKIKTKLADVLKTFAEAINTAILEHLNRGPDTKTSNYTTIASDYNTVLECSGTFTVSLGDAATMTAGYFLTVKNAGSGTITVDTDTGGDQIDGETSVTLNPGESSSFMVNNGSDGYLEMERRDPAWVSTTAASGVATVDSQSWDAGYDYEIEADGIVPASDGVNLELLLEVSSAWQTAYRSGTITMETGGSVTGFSTDSATEITLTGSGATLGTATNEVASLKMSLTNPGNASDRTIATWKMGYFNSDNNWTTVTGSGVVNTTGAVTGARIQASSGNITGNFTVRRKKR